MKTILITGATGNVGSEVVKALREKLVRIVVAVLDPAQPEPRLDPDLERVCFVFGEEASYAPAFQGWMPSCCGPG